MKSLIFYGIDKKISLIFYGRDIGIVVCDMIPCTPSQALGGDDRLPAHQQGLQMSEGRSREPFCEQVIKLITRINFEQTNPM